MSESIVRIPLTIVAPLGKTDGVIVAVMVTDLDALEADNERLRAAITQHHERIKTLGVNNTRDKPQWGGPWDHELWATLGLPSGPDLFDGKIRESSSTLGPEMSTDGRIAAGASSVSCWHDEVG